MYGFFYIVIRNFYKNGKFNHSIEEYVDKRQATTRYYNIIAADLGNNDVTYQYCEIKDCKGRAVEGLPPVVYDRRPPEPEPEPEVVLEE